MVVVQKRALSTPVVHTQTAAYTRLSLLSDSTSQPSLTRWESFHERPGVVLGDGLGKPVSLAREFATRYCPTMSISAQTWKISSLS